MNKPRIEDKNKVAKVLNKNGEVCETFTFREHGNSYLSAAQNYLWQNYDKLMSESNDYFSRRKAEEDRIADKRDKHGAKLPPLRKPKQTDYEKMRKERKEQGLDEEVEQMYESSETIHPKYTPKLRSGQSVKVKETGKSGTVGSMVHPHYYSVTVNGKTQTYHYDELQEKIDESSRPGGKRSADPRPKGYARTSGSAGKTVHGVKVTFNTSDGDNKAFNKLYQNADPHEGGGVNNSMTWHWTHGNAAAADRREAMVRKHFENSPFKAHKIERYTEKSGAMNEDVADLQELSKKTLASYVDKAEKNMDDTYKNEKSSKKWDRITWKRAVGIGRAERRLAKEEVEQMDEGFDDYRSMAQDLINKHGNKITSDHIDELENARDTSNPLDRDELLHHIYRIHKQNANKPIPRWPRSERKGLEEASGGKLGRYIVAARNRETEEKKKGQEFVQQMKDAGLKGFAPPLRHKGPHKGQSSRENMIKLAVTKLTNPNFSSPVKVPATESVVLHEDAVEGFKNGIIRRLHNMTHPESGKPYMIHMLVKHGFDKVNDAVNSAAEFHGDGAEEIGSSDITAATNSTLRDLGEKHLEERSLTPAEQKKKEEIIMAMKRKGQEPKYGAATAVAKRVAENKIYTNVIAKLEEGRKPKEGSKAWDRQQERLKAGGAETETPHVVAQLMKHSDYGDKPHTYKFSDGSSHEVTPRQRDKVLTKLRSMTGPGKKPEDREKLYHEVNTAKGFFHHTGDKPMEPEKRHPMSLQK